MKKFMSVVFTMLLAGSLAFAQTGGGSTGQKAPVVKTTGKKATKSHKSHKGGKKSKKGSTSAATTTTPK
jgi:hypothetical protein